MTKLNALLVAGSFGLLGPLLSIFSRAGFNLDVITIDPFIEKSKFKCRYDMAYDLKSMMEKLREKNPDHYDIIVVSSDDALQHILRSDMSIAQKLKLLPVNSEENFEHIYSKIGLSRVLERSGVATPPFVVAENFPAAVVAAEKLGYPIMVKLDSSGGGNGVFECNNLSALNEMDKKIFLEPVLIQKKINGVELDLSAFYRDGKLVHFGYSEVKKVEKKFGPSLLRVYKQLCGADEKLFTEMRQLGAALGANGFVNISAMQSDDGRRYFIEADMRPNVWMEYTKYIGDDPALRIAQWFESMKTLDFPASINHGYPLQLQLPYFHRMAVWEILRNRYGVWKYLPWHDKGLLLGIFGRDVFCVHQILRAIKRSPTTLIRLILPQKEDRAMVRERIGIVFARIFIRRSC